MFFRSGVDTSLEVLALRQQVAVLKRKRPRSVFAVWSFAVYGDDPRPAMTRSLQGCLEELLGRSRCV